MLKKRTKHTGHTQLQLDYHYKKADFKKSKGEKNSFEKSQDSRRVLVCISGALEAPRTESPVSHSMPHINSKN